jgi:hypothetical protein
MEKNLTKKFITGVLLCFISLSILYSAMTSAEVVVNKPRPMSVTYWDSSKAYNGYTLFAPLSGKDIYLINMKGEIVHHWDIGDNPGCHGELLPNGNLLYGTQCDPNEKIKAGAPKASGQGGIIREVDWNGKVVWEYMDPLMHHDFCRMKNGNTLVMKYVLVPFEIMIKVKGGVSGTEEDGKMWVEQLDEVTPEGKVVWSWKGYEHLDLEKDVIGPLDWRKEWTHGNSVEVLDNGDILTSFRNIDLVCIIDKKTGDIKWRYGQGAKEVAHMHDPHILPNGNMLIFDNGFNRKIDEVTYSRVVELEPKSKEVKWEYKSPVVVDFYTPACGNAQRLPNGNTLICETMEGRIFEITPKGEIVWDYTSPFFAQYLFWGNLNWVFRAYRYAPDWPEMSQAKDLGPAKYEKINKVYGPEAFK